MTGNIVALIIIGLVSMASCIVLVSIIPIRSDKSNTVLVFPKGTIVKFAGIPCELLRDTPYESAHFRSCSENEKAAGK